MIKYPNAIYLEHSAVFFLPIINSFLYLLQFLLLKNNLIFTVFFSRRNNKIKQLLIDEINRKNRLIICKTYLLSHVLKKINSKIILDVEVKNLEKFKQQVAYDIMWTLVFTNLVTPLAKKSLQGIIPEDFPVSRIFVIPYHDRFNVVCDYVFQTAKILSNNGNIVYLLAYQYPKWFIFNMVNQTKEGINGELIYYPEVIFPIFFNKFKFIEKINQNFLHQQILRFLRKMHLPILWCFEHQDLELVKDTKKNAISIYDCVDYINTIDSKINQIAQSREAKLIKEVDYFFVISAALKKIKSRIRQPNSTVVQGFDLVSFTDQKYTNLELSLIKKLKSIFKNIPRPLVGFVGNLSYRIDFKLLKELIPKLQNISFIFTNALLLVPNEDIYRSTSEEIKEIRKFKNVYFIPKVSNKKLIKEIIKFFDIAMIPYDSKLDFNLYSYPMKLFEYFYCGKPVVSTEIEELQRFPKFVRIGKNASEWKKIITQLLADNWPILLKHEQRNLARMNSWEKKISSILHLIRI